MTANRALAILVVLAVVLGVVLRFRAVDANQHPHGDVHLDAVTLHSFQNGLGLTTPIERAAPYRVESPPTTHWGYPADQHPPLALLLAAALSPLESNSYAALQRASLVTGLALIALVWLLARRMAPNHAGLAAAFVASSFALADFSGNGAVYMQHGMLAVLALFPLASRSPGATLLSGAALGLAYLTNYQALVLLPAAFLAIGITEGRGAITRSGIARLLGLGVGFALVVLPWWLRNYQLFGEPTYSVNPYYVKYRLGGVLSLIEGAAAGTEACLLAIDWPAPSAVVGPLVSNLIVNVRFVLSQSPLWLAAALPLAAGAGVALFSRRADETPGDARSKALVLFVLSHLAIMLVWPACKFRYFVPLAPLIALLAARGLEDFDHRFAPWLRRGAIAIVLLIVAELLLRGRAGDGVSVLLLLLLASVSLFVRAERRAVVALGAFLLSQAILYVASPTRTTYFDGIIVADSFKQRDAEARDRARQADLAKLPAELVARGVTTVVADVELKSHAIAQGIDLKVLQGADLPDPVLVERVLRANLLRRGPLVILVEGDETLEVLRTFAGFEESSPLLDGRWSLARFVR